MKNRVMRNSLKFILFIFFTWYVFAHLTYLYRNANDDRIRILSFEDETENSLDMVYVGASCAFVFWNPMVAWQEYGITSYDYAMSNMPAAIYLPAIKEVQKTQTPKVVVVDLRTFLSPVWNSLSEKGVNLGGYRSITDSWKLSMDRIEAIAYYCELNKISVNDGLSSYIDLMYYHTNRGVLSNIRNWYLWKNSTGEKIVSSDFKGYMANHDQTDRIAVFGGFVPPATDEEGSILEDSERCFRDLLQYCTSREIPLLITASPYIVSEERAKQTNTFARIAAEYGVPFLDTNKSEIWEQMGLDPSVDFYNNDHVNVLGAEKYTLFLADYLVQNFELPDHRNDTEFASWQEMYDNNYLPYMEPLKEYTRGVAIQYQKAVDDEKQMRYTQDATEWFSLADNENMTLLICANKLMESQPSGETALILNKFGLSDYISGVSNTVIDVYAGTVLHYDNAASRYDGQTKTPQNPSSFRSTAFSVSIKGSPAITVNGKDYFDRLNGNLFVVVIDNNNLQVVDSVSIDITGSGDMSITHLDF